MASMSLQAAYDQARQWLESNDLDRAIGLAQHILDQYPENLEAYRILGEAYLANRQLDRAQEAFERVLRSDPENIPAHVGLGITYERQGKLDRAMPEFEQALEIKPDMAELRSQLLRLYAEAWGSENAQLRLSRAGLARLYAKGHMLPQAIGEFRQVIADQPGRFDAMVALAEALWRDGQEDEAISLCRDILSRRPESLKANLILGYLEMASGRPEGERYWQAARDMDPYQVVAKAMFEALPPDSAGEPTIDEWDETAWRQRQLEAQQERMPATRPMQAVTPVATPVAESFQSPSRPGVRAAPPSPPAPANALDSDDFLAGLLALHTPPTPPAPSAPISGPEDEELDLEMTPFSLDDLDSEPPAEKAAPAPAPAAADEEEPAMTPFSLADLGLSDEEIAGLESLDTVSASAPERQPAPPSSSEDEITGMQPFSLADLGLSEEEIAGLDSLQTDVKERPAPGAGAPPAPKMPPPTRSEPAATTPAANEEPFDTADLPLDLQPFSLDELDLGTGGEADRGVGNLPPSLQPFSLDEAPPRPRVSGFAAEESFESVSDEEDFIPETGGYSWQQPTQRAETGFLRSSGAEPPSDEVSIFAKLKQRRQQEPEPEPEPLPPVPLEEDAHLGLFSLDDVSLRDEEGSAAPPPPAEPAPAEQASRPAPTPAPVDEFDNLQDAIAAGQMQPFSLADLGLSEEEIAALGLGGTTPTSAEASPPVAQPPEAAGAQVQPFGGEETPVAEQPVEEVSLAAPEPPPAEAAAEPAAAASEEDSDEMPLLTSDLKPFSLTDLGLSEEEIAALGLGASAEAEEDVSSELGITEEELAGLDLVDLNWSQPQSVAAPSEQPVAEPPAEAPAPQQISGDLVVDRLIALGRQQGYVDISDIIAGVEDPEAEAERIEEIGRLLHEARVEIRDGDEVIDMDAEYAEEEEFLGAPETEAPAPATPADEEPAMTPFSLQDLGLSDEEIAALGLGAGATPIEAETAGEAQLAAPEAEETTSSAPADEEPVMTPFSLQELGLSAEEIAALGLGAEAAPTEAEAAAAPAAPEAEAPTPAAPAEEEPVMTPFSLQDLGLSAEEIAALETGAFEPETPGATAEEPATTTEPAEVEAVAPPAEPREPLETVAPAEISPPPARAETAVPPTPPRPRVEATRTPPPATPAASQRSAGPPATHHDVLDSYLSQLEADPQNYALRLSVARVGSQIGMTDIAMQQYKQLIKRNELLDEVMDDLHDLISDIDDRQVLQRLHRLLGDVYSKQGRFREAIEEYSWTVGGPQNAR